MVHAIHVWDKRQRLVGLLRPDGIRYKWCREQLLASDHGRHPNGGWFNNSIRRVRWFLQNQRVECKWCKLWFQLVLSSRSVQFLDSNFECSRFHNWLAIERLRAHWFLRCWQAQNPWCSQRRHWGGDTIYCDTARHHVEDLRHVCCRSKWYSRSEQISSVTLWNGWNAAQSDYQQQRSNRGVNQRLERCRRNHRKRWLQQQWSNRLGSCARDNWCCDNCHWFERRWNRFGCARGFDYCNQDPWRRGCNPVKIDWIQCFTWWCA